MIVHRAETLALAIIDGRSFNLVGGNEAIRLLDSCAARCRGGCIGIHRVLLDDLVITYAIVAGRSARPGRQDEG